MILFILGFLLFNYLFFIYFCIALKNNLMQKTLLFAVLPFYCLFCYSQEQTAQSFIQKAEQALTKKEYKAAVIAFTQSVDHAKKDNNTPLLIKAYDNLGMIFIMAGEPKQAIDYYLLSLDLYKAKGDKSNIAKTSSDIAALYMLMKDYALALEYYGYTEQEARMLKNNLLLSDCLTGQGMVHEKLTNYNNALIAYDQALDLCRQYDRQSQIGLLLSLKGRVYNGMSDYYRSIESYKEALGYFDSLRDGPKVAETLNDLGRSFAHTGDYKESLQLHKQAYDDAKAIKFEKAVVDACHGLAIAYEGLHQYKETVLYRKLYDEKKDALNQKIQEARYATISLKYETEKAKRELELIQTNPLQKSESERKSGKYIIISCAGFGIAMIAASGYFWKGKQRLKKRIRRERSKRKLAQDKELQKLRLSKTVHGNIDSNLSRINYLSENIIQKSFGAPSIRNVGEAVQETTGNMTDNVSDLLSIQAPDEITIHGLVNRMSRYALDYLDNYSAEAVFSIPGNLPNSKITSTSHKELFSAVSLCISNIAGYAKASKIFFGIVLREKDFEISIKENGEGLRFFRLSNGVKTMQEKIKKLGGTAIVDNLPGLGTNIKITVPLSSLET